MTMGYTLSTTQYLPKVKRSGREANYSLPSSPSLRMSGSILLLLLHTLMTYTRKIPVPFSSLQQILTRNIERYRSVVNLMVHLVCREAATFHFREHCRGMATRCTGYPIGNLGTPLGRAQILRKLKSH
jgi:hypothetical protein